VSPRCPHISEHAVDQFRARHRTYASHFQALAELRGLALLAVPLMKTARGDDVCFCDDAPNIPLVIKDNTVVTVLPAIPGNEPSPPPPSDSLDALIAAEKDQVENLKELIGRLKKQKQQAHYRLDQLLAERSKQLRIPGS